MSTERLKIKKNAGNNQDNGHELADKNMGSLNANARGPQRLPDVENDLHRIKGVNKEIERALKKVGITNYEKLSSYTPEKLNDILRANDPPLTLSQAKLETIIMKATEFNKSKHKPVPTRAAQESAGPAAKKRQHEKHWENWEELADFFVSFGYEITRDGEKLLQTRVINYELDENQQWPQVAGNQLLDWILARSKALPSEPATEATVDPAASAVPAISGGEQLIQLSNLEVTEIPAPSPADSKELSLPSLRAEIRLTLSGNVFVAKSYEKYIAVAEVYLINTHTHRHQLAAYKTYQYFRDTPGCDIKLEFMAPEVGDYRLCLAVRLFPLGETAYVEGPIIHIQHKSN